MDNLVFIRDVSYWLTLARINELALLCTENYANNGEIALVGDLLLNPRLILIHVRGQNRPIIKKRHTPLTEQFGSVAETYPEVVQWLKTETSLEIKTPALLPYLHQKLEGAGCFSKEYFNALDKRKTRIAVPPETNWEFRSLSPSLLEAREWSGWISISGRATPIG